MHRTDRLVPLALVAAVWALLSGLAGCGAEVAGTAAAVAATHAAQASQAKAQQDKVAADVKKGLDAAAARAASAADDVGK